MKKSKHLPRDPIWVCTGQTHSAWSCPLNYIFHALLLFLIIFWNDCMIILIENVCITFSWHTKTWCFFFFCFFCCCFIFKFSFLTFNFLHRGKDAFSSISETIFLKTVEFTTFCVSMISSFFFPRARQAKYYMIQGSVSLDSHSSSSRSDSGGNYEKYRSVFQCCSEC